MIVSFCAMYFISRIPAVPSAIDKTESKRFTKTAKSSNAFFSVSTFPMIVHYYSKWLVSSRCAYNMVNFGPLTAEIDWRVWAPNHISTGIAS